MSNNFTSSGPAASNSKRSVRGPPVAATAQLFVPSLPLLQYALCKTTYELTSPNIKVMHNRLSSGPPPQHSTPHPHLVSLPNPPAAAGSCCCPAL